MSALVSKVASLERYFSTRSDSGVASVYLFGSHAAGRSHRDSDIDLGILLRRQRYPEARDRFEARVRLGADLIQHLRENQVDVVILNDAPPLLGRRIVSEGVRAFCSDPAADHAYVRDVQLRAADVEPFLRRMRRKKLEALAQ
jgi:predicted nucleotidyltransferase